MVVVVLFVVFVVLVVFVVIDSGNKGCKSRGDDEEEKVDDEGQQSGVVSWHGEGISGSGLGAAASAASTAEGLSKSRAGSSGGGSR